LSSELCWFCDQPHLVPENDIGKCANCLVDIDRTGYILLNIPLTETLKEDDMPIPKEVKETNYAPFIKLPNIVENKEGEIKVGDSVTIATIFDAPLSAALKSPLVGDVTLVTGETRALGLNWTSYYEIVKDYGKNTDDWVGKQLVYNGMKKCGKGALGHIWTAKI